MAKLADALFNYADTGNRRAGTRYFSTPNINPGQTGIASEAPPRNVGLQISAPDPSFQGFNERGSFDAGGGAGNAQGGATPGGMAGAPSMGQMGLGASLAGALTGNADLGLAGGALGAGAAASKGNFGPVGSLAGGLMGGQYGSALGGALGLGLSGENVTGKDIGNFGARTALGLASPILGMAYGAANSLSKGALGDALFGKDISFNAPTGEVTAPTSGVFGSFGKQGFSDQDVSSLGLTGGMVGPGVPGRSYSGVSMSTMDMAGPLGVGKPGFGQTTIGRTPFSGLDVTPGMGDSSSGGNIGSTGIDSGLGRGGEDGADRGGFNGGIGAVGPSGADVAGPSGNGDFGGAGGFGGADMGGSSGNGTDGMGNGGGPEGWKNGGMITPQRMSGLHRRYADGGQVGNPMLAQALYADGGQVGLGAGQPMDPQMADMKINDLLKRPGAKEQITARARQLMQTGSLTPEEVQKMGQIARACMQNPNLYPQLRKFAAAEGLGNLPPQYNPETIMKIMAVARALGVASGGPNGPGQQPMDGQAQMAPGGPGGAYANGGVIVGPGDGRSDSVHTTNRATGEPVSVSNGEYIIPEHVVQAKGKDFFDSLLRKYSPVSGTRQGA